MANVSQWQETVLSECTQCPSCMSVNERNRDMINMIECNACSQLFCFMCANTFKSKDIAMEHYENSYCYYK